MEEIIYYGCEFVATAVKLWAAFQILSCLHDPKTESATEKLVCGVGVILLSGLNTYNSSTGAGLFSNNMLFFLSVIVGVFGIILYESKFIRIWYESLIFLILTALLDFFVLALLCSMFQQTTEWADGFVTAGLCRGIYLLVFSAFLVWAVRRIARWLQANRQLWKGYWKNRGIWVFAIVVSLSMCMIYFQRIYKLLLSPGYYLWMALFVMSSALCIVFAVVYLTWKKIREREEAEHLKLTLMEKKYHELLRVQKEKEQLIHDTKNHLHAIRSLAKQGQMEQIQDYVDALNEKAEEDEIYEWTGNTMLDLILSEKIGQAQRENIETEVICDRFPDMVLSTWEICALFANLLDNSIEANLHQPEGGERWIHLVFRKQGYMLGVTIMNPIQESFNSEDGFPDTTKEDKAGHGIGLYSMQSVLDAHEGRMMFQAENGIFKLVLTFTAFRAID